MNDRQAVTTISEPSDQIIKTCEGDDMLGDYSVDATKVDAVLAKYVGVDQKGGIPKNYGGCGSYYYYYENEKFYFGIAHNSSIMEWAQAINLIDNNDGTYTVVFDTYDRIDANGNLVDFPENHYDVKENWGDSTINNPSHRLKAVIKKGTWNDSEVWQLISMSWFS